MADLNPYTSLEYENVNGIKLTLNVYKRQTSPKSRQFTITFKNVNSGSSRLGAKASVFLAIIFNLIAFIYVRISLTAILVIIISLSFLVYFWFTHSVQSAYAVPLHSKGLPSLLLSFAYPCVLCLIIFIFPETLLIIPTVCIQSTIKYVWGREDTFVDWSNIDDVIINEVIKMNRVLYYLTVLKKEDNPDSVNLVPLFKYTKPRLFMLQKIYFEIQTFLMDSQKETAMASGDKE